jgi:2-oxoglutarate dehydrogenase E2 component (dihydrolipoamide succinyltransferase)
MIIEVKVPSPGESITEVEIATWLVKDGDLVQMDDVLAEINSDKATLTINAESDGKISLKSKDGEVVKVGQIVATIDTSVKAEIGASKTPSTETSVVNAPVTENYAKGLPSVSADKMILEKGLKTEEIKGTGKGGRITKTDVLKSLDNPPVKEQATTEVGKKIAAETKTQPVIAAGSRSERREKMTSLRRKISERLVNVKNQTAMLTTFNEVDMSSIMELRKKYKDKFKEVHGVGLGFMSFFTKACTEALAMFPAVNGRVDGEEIVYHHYADVGVAVSTERGLVVPILRNAEGMSLSMIEKTIMDFGGRAREGKLTIEEMTGGTFTITNGGVFGSMLSTPILNPPQSAILGMHNIVERPVALNGQVVIRPIMYVALSYDHRIIDGKEAVSFLFKVKELLEDPARMLLGF